jgi:hypothetical protein
MQLQHPPCKWIQALAWLSELVGVQGGVIEDLADQARRDVSPGMVRDDGGSAVRVFEENVASLLTCGSESVIAK